MSNIKDKVGKYNTASKHISQSEKISELYTQVISYVIAAKDAKAQGAVFDRYNNIQEAVKILHYLQLGMVNNNSTAAYFKAFNEFYDMVIRALQIAIIRDLPVSFLDKIIENLQKIKEFWRKENDNQPSELNKNFKC